LAKIPVRRVQEEVLLSQGKFALHAKFNAFTYKSLGLQNNNDSRFAIVINKKGRAISDAAYTILQLNLDLLLNLPPESSKLN
jgi:hypothetical protein